jgi:hypothetical protein
MRFDESTQPKAMSHTRPRSLTRMKKKALVGLEEEAGGDSARELASIQVELES